MIVKVVGVASLALVLGVALAQERKVDMAPREHVRLNEDELAWKDGPPSLPAGAQMAVLAGDPHKEGLFTIRLKVPRGYKILPHWHPTDEILTIIDGNLAMGTGERFDTTKAKELKRGGYCYLPAEHRHFAYAVEATIVELTSPGPFEIHYVRSVDDPRNARKD